jgi:hypothetical protein
MLTVPIFVLALNTVPAGQVRLLPSPFLQRANLNREYVVSLKTQNLLQNYYLEAGLWSPRFRMTGMGEARRGDDIHWGWESPTCQLRGHFLGHWLSAAAYLAASRSDTEVRGKAEHIVSELARIQQQNGGRWAGSIPENYLFWIARGKRVWAPHYTVHKTFMGLLDMQTMTGDRQALEIAEKFAAWFHEWTRGFTREQMDDILDVETGGMLEVWADLYGITRKPVYLDLIEKYRRQRLFNPLVEGKDPLTNKHANTTIPEAHGAARAYEVTGEAKWRDIAQAYWKSAVTDRGYYATGGQTNGEVWTPPLKLSARLGEKTQEHCVVYNMIRLADFLLRWTGQVEYADYIERNLYNGILAQQHPETGMVAYFLPLQPGARKVWGSPTNDFWCCHGTLVQAHTRHDRLIYYTSDAGLMVAQYIPSEVTWKQSGVAVRLTQTTAAEADDHLVHRGADPHERPSRWVINMKVAPEKPTEFTLTLRLPWWLRGQATLTVNGTEQPIESRPSSLVSVRRVWKGDSLRLVLPKGLTTSSLPDRPDMVAFMDGPVVLAGLTSEEPTLYGDKGKPETILIPDNEREWRTWLLGYRTTGQDRNIRFLPLNAITDQAYTVYFPVRGR